MVRTGSHRVTLGTIVTVAALVLAGCGASGGGSGDSGAPGVTDSSILIGASTPLSGPVASSCKPVSDSSAAWFDAVNAKGGVNGRQIEWRQLDDAYDLSRAAANGKTLVADNVFAVFGGCGTVQPPALIPQLKSAGVPYLWPTAQVAEVYTPPTEGFYGFSPSYPAYFQALVPFAMKKDGPGSVMVLLHQAAGMEQAEDMIKKQVEAAGGTFLGGDIVPAATADFTPYVLKMKQAQPDYVISTLPQAPGAKFLQAASDQNFAPTKKFLNVLSWAGAQVTDPFKTPSGNKWDDKIVVATQTKATDSPDQKACVDAITQYAPNVALGLDALLGCNSAQWFTNSLAKIDGVPTRDKLNTLLQGMNGEDLSTGTAPVTMSADRHLTTSELFMFELQGGRYVDVGTAPVSGDS